MSMNKANTPGAQKATSHKRSDKNAHPRTASQQVKQPTKADFKRENRKKMERASSTCS